MTTCAMNGELERMKERLIKYRTDKKGDPVYVYDKNGLLYGYFTNKTMFSEKVNGSVSAIAKAIDEYYTVKGFYVFSSYKGLSIDYKRIINNRRKIASKANVKKLMVSLSDINTGELVTFDSYRDASKWIGKNVSYVSKAIKRGKNTISNYNIILH